MIPDENIDTLAMEMARRHKEGSSDDARSDQDAPEPFILFMGTECATAAGVPTIEKIARELLSGAGGIIEAVLPGTELANKDELLESFYNLLDDMSGGEIFRMMQNFYVNIPVPVFYQDLALLIKNHYFNRILTTNIDTLLEQALSGAGVRYRVTSLGTRHQRDYYLGTGSGTPDDERNLAHIIKLHGDIGQGRIKITPDQIEEALRSRRSIPKQALKGDIVMVGYEFENTFVNDWLKRSHERELWWVNEKQPQPQKIDAAQWDESIKRIVGEVGKPEIFFSQLYLRLLRLPVLETLSRSPADIPGRRSEKRAAKDVGIYGEPGSAPEADLEDLRGQIRRSLVSINQLEQSTTVGEPSPNIQTQIVYEKQHLVELEDRLRSNESSKLRLIELVREIMDSIHQAYANPDNPHVDYSSLTYVQSQYKRVVVEYESEQPSQRVISSAIGATVLLADRLNTEAPTKVVNPDLVRELASFAPVVIARGIR